MHGVVFIPIVSFEDFWIEFWRVNYCAKAELSSGWLFVFCLDVDWNYVQ